MSQWTKEMAKEKIGFESGFKNIYWTSLTVHFFCRYLIVKSDLWFRNVQGGKKKTRYILFLA